VDGTLAASNVVLAYLDFRTRHLSPLGRWAFLALFVPRLAYYALLDWRSRGLFNLAFYRNYAGVPREEVEAWAEEAVDSFWRPRLFPQALARLEWHRAQGHRIVLLSGGLEVTLAPLARRLGADALVAARLEEEGGRFTGRLGHPPLSGEEKAHAARRVAQAMGLNLGRCYAYADSYADRHLLGEVGHPVAVNPDHRLRRLARRRGWPICLWGRAGREAP